VEQIGSGCNLLVLNLVGLVWSTEKIKLNTNITFSLYMAFFSFSKPRSTSKTTTTPTSRSISKTELAEVKNTMASSTNRSYLLELPIELRLTIYNCLFRINTSDMLASGLTNTSSLLLVCRQLHDEALPYYQRALSSYVRVLRDGISELKAARDCAGDFGTILTCLCLEGLYADRLAHILKRAEVTQSAVGKHRIFDQ
jgi:hypothetical protein